MPRHPSVPDNQTGWVRLGTVTTDTAMFAIVTPEAAGILGDEWAGRYIDEDGEPLPPSQAEHELVEFEELEAGEESAVLFTTHSDGNYAVEGRLGDIYRDGRMSLTEVRIRIWVCECTCHDSEDPEQNVSCDGDCHDQDPG